MKKKAIIKQKNESRLIVGVKSDDAMFEDARAILKQLDKGKNIEPVNRLYFPTAAYMWKQLSPQRLEALYCLRQKGAMSIRKLAAQMKRDYRAVHRDIQILLSLSLAQKRNDGLVFVPWNSIVIELAHSAAA